VQDIVRRSMSAFLYVGGLNVNVSEEDLFQAFSLPIDDNIPSGLISSKINRDVITRASRCSGFLNFATPEDAQRTLELRQHMEVAGRPAVLKPYRVRDPEADASITDNADSIFKPISNKCNTFVTPLPRGMTESELATLMSHHFADAVVSCHIPPGRPYGYVLFKSEATTMAAISKGSIEVSTVANVDTEEEQKAMFTVNILPYKSFNDRIQRNNVSRETPKRKAETPQIRFNRELCVAIRGAPQKWTDAEVQAAVKPYGDPVMIKFVGANNSSQLIVVEFSDAASVTKCVEGLDRRWCSGIDQFSLLNSLESQRVSLLLDRQRERDYNAPRLNVSYFNNDSRPMHAWGRTAKRRGGKGPMPKSNMPASDHQPAIPGNPISSTNVV